MQYAYDLNKNFCFRKIKIELPTGHEYSWKNLNFPRSNCTAPYLGLRKTPLLRISGRTSSYLCKGFVNTIS